MKSRPKFRPLLLRVLKKMPRNRAFRWYCRYWRKRRWVSFSPQVDHTLCHHHGIYSVHFTTNHRHVTKIRVLGWGLLSRFPPLRYFPDFSTPPKHMLAIEYHVQVWQVLPQLSCGDTCQRWMRFKECNRYFCEIANFAYGEIDERSFSNPHPWNTPSSLPESGWQHVLKKHLVGKGPWRRCSFYFMCGDTVIILASNWIRFFDYVYQPPANICTHFVIYGRMPV